MSFKIGSVVVEARDGGCGVRLDGKPLHTPGRTLMLVPSEALAAAIAAEWAAQSGAIRPDTMPMMQLAATALDRIAPQRAQVVDALVKYAETDLLCHRADAPPVLVERQARIWQPLLDWAALRFDAALQVQAGIMPRPQPEGAMRAVRTAVEAHDDMRLTALQFACGGLGSIVLALALLDRRVDPEEAFEAAELDATFQIEKWGEDEEAARRRASLRIDIRNASRFLDLLDGTPDRWAISS
jgi:chaperone required for assembly of F1-ATPase